MHTAFDRLSGAARARVGTPVPLMRGRILGALPRSARTRLQVVVVAISLSAVAVAVTSLSPVLAGRTPFLLSLVAITASGWLGGALGGIVATATTSVGVLSLLLPLTTRSFDSGDGLVLGAFIISAFVITWFNTNLQTAQHRLLNSELLSKIVVDNAPLLVAAADDQGNIVLFNQACERITGRNRDEVMGKPFVETLVPAAWHSTVAARFSALANVDLTQPHMNPWNTQRGEERTIEWRCYQVPVGAGRWTVGVGIDVTERNQTEARLTAALDREQATSARLTQATVARERFITVLAHELRNPLQAVLNWAGTVTRMSSDETARSAAARIDANSRLMTRLLDDVMDVSRIQNGKLDLRLTVVDLVALVSDEVRSFEPRALEKNVNVRIESHAPTMVNGDPDRVRQMVANLLSNALRFAPAHSTITARVTTSQDLAEVTIQDEGPEVSTDPSKWFEPFWQGDGHANGVGIGLALVAELAEMHGGSARAASNPSGQGAVVAFSIPTARSMTANRTA